MTRSRPTVSVVVPVKSDSALLRRCLDALSTQSRPADELIVVDNGSTDDSAEVARSRGARVLTEPRPGITAASARGYDEARSDVIARCDADSIVASDWVERIATVLEEIPDAAAVTGTATFYDLSSVGNRLARTLYLDGYFVTMGAALANRPLFGSNFALRRAVWERIGGSVPRDNPLLHDDLDLSYRLHPTERIVFDPELRVAISGRPFRSGRGMLRRFRMAGVTMHEHLPAGAPPARWAERLAARATTENTTKETV